MSNTLKDIAVYWPILVSLATMVATLIGAMLIFAWKAGGFVGSVRTEIKALNNRMDGFANTLDGVNKRMDGLTQRLDKLTSRVDILYDMFARYTGKAPVTESHSPLSLTDYGKTLSRIIDAPSGQALCQQTTG